MTKLPKKKIISKAFNSEKTTTTAVKAVSKSDSILIQVDEETGRIMQIISDSISSEILEKLEKLKSYDSSDNSYASMKADIKKLSKRIDEILEQFEELSDKVEKMNQNCVKILKLLNSKEGKE